MPFVLLSDHISSGSRLESLSEGYKINCTVFYRGLHRPELRWYNGKNTAIPAADSLFVTIATSHVVSSEIFVRSNDQSASPVFCQLTVPLYRCNELSSVYTLKFPIHCSCSDGEYVVDLNDTRSGILEQLKGQFTHYTLSYDVVQCANAP